MPEEKMIEILYEDFVELMKAKGHMDAALAFLRMQNCHFIGIDEVLALLTGDASCGAE